MPIKNYTTRVGEHRTVAEIQQILASKGASSISVQYDERGRPSAVQFLVSIGANPVPFKLPCNFAGVEQALKKSRFAGDSERARRVAWRIVKDWVEAQMALIEAGQAQMAQVFLPYAVNDHGVTMFERFMDSHKQLGTGAQQ